MTGVQTCALPIFGACTAAQTGKPGRKDSGNAMSRAPFPAASAISAQALSTVASGSRKTGATCAAQTLKAGYSITRVLLEWRRQSARAGGRQPPPAQTAPTAPADRKSVV